MGCRRTGLALLPLIKGSLQRLALQLGLARLNRAGGSAALPGGAAGLQVSTFRQAERTGRGALVARACRLVVARQVEQVAPDGVQPVMAGQRRIRLGFGESRRRCAGRHLPGRGRGGLVRGRAEPAVRTGPRRNGVELARIELDRGCFACALGGPDRRTLFLTAAEMPDFSGGEPARTGQVLTVPATAPGVGWP